MGYVPIYVYTYIYGAVYVNRTENFFGYAKNRRKMFPHPPWVTLNFFRFFRKPISGLEPLKDGHFRFFSKKWHFSTSNYSNFKRFWKKIIRICFLENQCSFLIKLLAGPFVPFLALFGPFKGPPSLFFSFLTPTIDFSLKNTKIIRFLEWHSIRVHS